MGWADNTIGKWPGLDEPPFFPKSGLSGLQGYVDIPLKTGSRTIKGTIMQPQHTRVNDVSNEDVLIVR